MARAGNRHPRTDLAIGVLLLAVVVVGGYVAREAFMRGDTFAIFDDPKRTISLPNDAGAPRLMRRCKGVDECRFPDEDELVEPRDSFEFKLYLDEDRTYVVAGADGATLGCITVPVANGSPYANSLSDIDPCPRGTPEST